MVHKRFTVNVSWRYFVMGVYADRNEPIIRIYPCPFVRISWEMT
jgi:hypothetical protein